MTHYLVAEILGIFFLEAESVVICLLFPVLELDYEIYLLFFLYTLYSVKCFDIDDSDASKLYKVSGYLRRCAHERMLVDLSDFHHIIRHETMASSDELECGLTLSYTALTCDHNSLTVYIYQHAVHCDAWRELLTKTIYELSHKA